MTRRLLLGYLVITVLVLVALEVPLGLFYAQREEARLVAAAEGDATILASYYEDALDQGAPLDPTFANRYTATTGARVILVTTDGLSLLDTGADPGRDFSTRPEVITALSGVRSSGIRRSDTLNTDLLYVAVPVASGGTVHGVLRLTTDAHEVTETIQRFWFGLVGVAAVVLAAATTVGWAVARSVTQPLRALERSAARFAAGDLTPDVIPPDAPPEVAALGGAMNAMALRLDELLSAQRAFVSDASHQLRTPLTALRLRLDNIDSGLDSLRGPGSPDSLSSADSRSRAGSLDSPNSAGTAGTGRLRSEIAAAGVEVERLGELVESLLRLARAERPASPVAVDVAAVTRDRVDVWTAVADDAGVRLRLDAPASAMAMAVPGAVEQILDNVIDNALSFSPPDAEVMVTVAVTRAGSAGEVALSVADQGPGLDDERKARALERFWRGDALRPGTGLGLPIAASLAAASGGRLELGDATPTGLCVTARFPSCPTG